MWNLCRDIAGDIWVKEQKEDSWRKKRKEELTKEHQKLLQEK